MGSNEHRPQVFVVGEEGHLRAFGPSGAGSDRDWQRVGNITQAYGVAYALIAGLALAGVGASLFLRARKSKANREQGYAPHTPNSYAWRCRTRTSWPAGAAWTATRP